MDRVILHFDLDCFYAQVHMVQEPELRLKPLGVQQKTIFATVNYVARARGVPKMARISEAQRICPDIVIRNGEDLTDYREASEHIFAFLQEQFPHCPVERLGLDEFFVDATTPAHALCSDGFWSPTPHFHLTASPNWCGHPAAHAAANLAQYQALRAGAQLTDWARKELKAKFGYTCSAGIAVNKLQAKMAGELHKPDDQSCLLPRAAQAVILHRGLRRVSPAPPLLASSSFTDMPLRSVDFIFSRLLIVVLFWLGLVVWRVRYLA
ncbi:uncharacterized protein MONBRDRAFT_14321 [Monosiga brevicollis MX1]|uniref:UmuC domain-containing protein n=1 Tax=Monosiga brevicollis TaxID=81824 RepID=A9UR36_MONBE|nr:uncharacterized protein MONBRDRAFT_14321 [Monosiga brevicollis MX1]EDQ91850.1 predicted protein [Monosiga brevicollis MX1]|eukprot:XP_001743136.1 hypothetical protein [Monosiga brevicollis MX1]